MKGLASAPGDYVYFKSQVPLHKISIGSKQWRYYDFGPKSVPPLICLPGIAGTADVYYKQIMSLSLKGYRVISVDLPRVWNHLEWVHAFEKFLDTINVHHVHLYGTSLGGFLAQIFAQYRPRRVKSLVLSNTFLDTEKFSASMPWSPVVGWTPSFLLKRYILTGIRDGPQEPFIADSVDFVVGLLCQSVVHYEKRTRHSFVNERFRDHVTVNFARSGGPGGQNVNKVNTKVDMRFNVNKAQWLGERVRERILQTEKNRINKDGDLVISSTKTRTQKGNIEDALSKLQEIIDSASYVPPPPSEEQKKRIQKLAAIEEQKRMQNKRALSQKKAIRRTRDSWD